MLLLKAQHDDSFGRRIRVFDSVGSSVQQWARRTSRTLSRARGVVLASRVAVPAELNTGGFVTGTLRAGFSGHKGGASHTCCCKCFIEAMES